LESQTPSFSLAPVFSKRLSPSKRDLNPVPGLKKDIQYSLLSWGSLSKAERLKQQRDRPIYFG
jgi:hypothetical protein